MRKLSKRTTIVAASAVTVMTVSGIAYAYYLAGVVGTGSGTATPAANNSAAVTWTASTVSGLVPGGDAVDSTFTFTNPNSYAVNYTGRTIALDSVSGPTGCASNATALLSIDGAPTLAAGVLAAGATTTVTVPVKMADSTTVDQTACAGASLTLNYTVS